MLQSICQQVWKTHQWPLEKLTGKGQFSFQSQRKAMPKEVQITPTIAFMSYARKIMLKILQTGLQQYMSRELPDVQAGCRKDGGTRDQTATICWIIEKAREFQKYICFCFTNWLKPLTVWIAANFIILLEMGIWNHITYLLRNRFAGQEATVRTGQETMAHNWERGTSKLYIVTLLI